MGIDTPTAEILRLRRLVEEKDALILQMAERIAAASEVLSRLAEKKKKKPTPCWLADRYTGRRCEHAQKDAK